MELIAFKDKFPKKMSKLLLYNENFPDKFEILYFGYDPRSFGKYDTYLYLVEQYTHWMYCSDLTKLLVGENILK